MTEPYLLAFPQALVIVDPAARYLEVRFLDGTSVPAQAEDTDEARERAAALGYDGPDPTWAMTRDHDLWHLWRATPGVSPVLWGIAHPDEAPEGDLAREEEAAVLDMARRWNHAERIHGHPFPRPWEHLANRHGVKKAPLLWGWPDTADGGQSVRHQWVDVYYGPHGLGTEVSGHPRPLEGQQ